MKPLIHFFALVLLLGGAANSAQAYCFPPENIRCENINGINYLTWDPMQGVTHYEVQIEYNSPRCRRCSGPVTTTAPILVQGVKYARPYHPCYAYRVRARIPGNNEDCDDENPYDFGWSFWQCIDGTQDCIGFFDSPWGKASNDIGGVELNLDAWPNPITEAMTVRVEIPQTVALEVAVYDLAGRRVGILEEGLLEAGIHELEWKPAEGLVDGVYFLRAKGDGISFARKIVLDRH